MKAESFKILAREAIFRQISVTKQARARARRRRWRIERKKRGLCTRCGKPAVIHSKGKRTGQTSVYCADHLAKQREKNRDKQNLKRWSQNCGDLEAWSAVSIWLSGNSSGFAPLHPNRFQRPASKLEQPVAKK